jgi:hypothetical protein
LLQDSGSSHDLSTPRSRNLGFNLAGRACLNGPCLGATLFFFYFFFCFRHLTLPSFGVRGSWGASLYLGCEFSMCEPHIELFVLLII